MTELQSVEFDIFKCFVRVCEQLNLTYYLVCGSALGAAKYQGFIPWDDDMDVGLFREDYELFLEKAPALLPEHLFLQNYKSDPAFPQIFSKLRNSNTTYIEKSVAPLPINHGIYIDIFPLDGYPSDAREIKRLERQKSMFKKKLACVFDVERGWRSKAHYYFFRLQGYHKKTAEVAAAYDALASRYDTHRSALICNHGNWQGRLEYAPCEMYGEGVLMTFEGITVRVPERIDEYLTQKYGDWRADLPEDQKVGHHYYKVLDLEKPYTEYI